MNPTPEPDPKRGPRVPMHSIGPLILAALDAAAAPLSPHELAAATGHKLQSVRFSCAALARDRRVRRGWDVRTYTHNLSGRARTGKRTVAVFSTAKTGDAGAR